MGYITILEHAVININAKIPLADNIDNLKRGMRSIIEQDDDASLEEDAEDAGFDDNLDFVITTCINETVSENNSSEINEEFVRTVAEKLWNMRWDYAMIDGISGKVDVFPASDDGNGNITLVVVMTYVA